MYEKQNFKPGQKLKAAELNHMEEGIVNAVSVTEQTLSEAQKAQARENLGIDDIAGAHIGPEAPTNGEKLWIDTDEEAEEGIQMDVVAKVGQLLAVAEVDENGKPTKLVAVDLPQAETPNFAANEGEKGYIEGRTHYVDEKGIVHKLDNKFIDAEWMATTGKGRVAVLPKAEYICVDGIIDTFSHEEENAAIDRMEEFVLGETYVVTLNDTEYECVAYNMVSSSGNVSTLVGIGNQALCTQIPGADNGLPFFAYRHSQAGYNEVYLQNTEGEYTVNLGIDIVSEVPIKIPEKFLPESAATKEYVNEMLGVIENGTY